MAFPKARFLISAAKLARVAGEPTIYVEIRSLLARSSCWYSLFAYVLCWYELRESRRIPSKASPDILPMQDQQARSVIRSCRFGLIVALFCGIGLFESKGSGDDDVPAHSSEDQTVLERNQTSRLNDAELKRWNITSEDSRTSFRFSAEPAMRWSYFDTGRYYGDLYIVTGQDRPVAVFAMFRWFHPVVRSYVCATALTDSPIVARRNGMIRWQPRTSAIQWNPLPGDQPRIETRSNRLVQMRRIARRFSGTVSDRAVVKKATVRKLRLLPQPIYRYSAEDSDGAIFAFANGTTPAVLLCVEADLTSKATGWRYGIARRWSWESRMNYNGKEVWMAPSARPRTTSSAPYYLAELPGENAAD